MSDWSQISGQDFHARVNSSERLEVLVGTLILDRLPFTFESKEQYFAWRHQLAAGIHVDPRDIIIVGSSATGVSLSALKKFRPFGSHSDVDIAVISGSHFEQAWAWFRRSDPVLLGLDQKGRDLFNKHRSHYIFEGVVAANYFLSYLPFKQDWNQELQRSEAMLPEKLRGRPLRVRIYKDSESLRMAQVAGLQGFRTSISSRGAG